MRYSAAMSEPEADPPEEPLPKIPIGGDETKLIVVLVALVLGLWAGGSLLAHYIWDINWVVAVLVVPAAVAVVYGLLKLFTRPKKK